MQAERNMGIMKCCKIIIVMKEEKAKSVPKSNKN